MKISESINNENGSVIILVLVVLVMFTIIGISALDFSTVETRIAHNDRGYKQNLYRAESAVMEAAELIVITPDKSRLLPSSADILPGLYALSGFDPAGDIEWNTGGFDAKDSAVFDGTEGLKPQYIISFIGQADGREDGVDFTRYEYAIHGRSTMHNSRVDVKAGYIIRF